nr:glycosyltransferase family 2 protein [uncultured Schaedlerella sp.]
MKTLGLVMIVKNEERCLGKCLERVKDLVDKIYITDTGSTDRTKEIADSFGAVVSDYVWSQDFSAARNFALDQSDCDWNLVLDADEYLIEGTRKDIEPFMENMEHVGAIQRKDYYNEGTVDGKEQVAYMYTWAGRLIPRGVRFSGRIHEQENSVFPAESLPLLFEHDGYQQGGKEERNLAILLEELNEKPKDPYLLFQTARTLRGMKRHEEACKYFEEFRKKVPLKGAAYRTTGLIQYLYSLIEIQGFDTALKVIEDEQERLWDYADFHFTCGIIFMKAILADTRKYIDYLPMIEQAYLRCLEIGEVPLHQGIHGCGSFKASHNLGTWYEVSGDISKALECYRRAADEGYLPSISRIEALENTATSAK